MNLVERKITIACSEEEGNLTREIEKLLRGHGFLTAIHALGLSIAYMCKCNPAHKLSPDSALRMAFETLCEAWRRTEVTEVTTTAMVQQ